MGTGSEPLSHAEVLGRWVGTFVDELVAWGLEDVHLCPGSRSTPLALAFARHPKINVWTHLDERSCAYFALGMAKTRGLAWPVAILCSSGTAAVNFAPAITEAYHSRVPLLVLTADRPPELQQVGANQTIDQHNLYGSAVKWFANVPLPDASPDMLRFLRMTASRAMSTINDDPFGPVHLNFPFREPLVPAAYEPRVLEAGSANRFTSRHGTYNPSTVEEPSAQPEPKKGVVVCGPNTLFAANSLGKLVEATGFPILADVLSGARVRPFYNENVITSYDAFLRVPEVVEKLRPDVILRFGDPPTSKPLASYLQRHRDVRQIVVGPRDRWLDPDLTAHQILDREATDFCLELAGRREMCAPAGWLQQWQDADAKSWAAIRGVFDQTELASEPTAAYDLVALAPMPTTIFAGNSMPVRDLDSFYPPVPDKGPQFFYANRGTSGIDGVVSTALGAAAKHGQVALLIGDLSFYHDMNGLIAAKRFGINATIVLINNDGGGIFSFLPQHEDTQHFEMLFGTPHGLDFAPVANLYGVGFQRVTTRDEYRAALKASFDSPGVQVIEIKTDRTENLALHQRIWDEVAKAVAS